MKSEKKKILGKVGQIEKKEKFETMRELYLY